MNEYLRPDDTRDALRKHRRASDRAGSGDDLHPQGPIPHGQPGPVGHVPDVPGGRDPRGLPVRGHLHAAPDGRAAPLAGGPQRLRADLRPLRAGPVRRSDRRQPERAPERLLDLRRDRGARLLRGLPGGGPRPVPARLDRGDHLLDRALGQDPLRRDRRPLGRLPRIARHPGDRAARGGVVRLAHQPRRRRRGRQRDGSLRGSGPLEGVRARHRRRHRGGDRLRSRDHGDRQPESAQREHTADPDQQLLGHHAAAGLARPGRRSARRSARAARSTSAGSAWRCSW